METEVYKCQICQKVIEIIKDGAGELICDGQPMTLMRPQDGEIGEKHIPIVEKTSSGFLVKVGTVPHPMTPEHWIQWIQLEVDGVLHRKQLLPSSKPEFEFKIPNESDQYIATAYCNVHGLWDSLSVPTRSPQFDDREFPRTDVGRFWQNN